MPFVRDLQLVATASILVRWVLRHAAWGVPLSDQKYVAFIFNNARDFHFHYLAVDSELKW